MAIDSEKKVVPLPSPIFIESGPVRHRDNMVICTLDSDDEREWSDGDSDASIVLPHHHRQLREDVVELGSQCEAKTLYEGPKKCKCCINWVEETPLEVVDAKKFTYELYGGSAILLRERKGHRGEDAFVLHSVLVQSPLIRQVLSRILAHYPGLHVDSKTVLFEAPFQPLFHHWDDIQQAAKDETRTETRNHLKVLIKALEPNFNSIQESVDDCRNFGKIEYERLWAILKPGSLLYTMHHERDSIVRLQSVTKGKEQYELIYEYVDWEGDDFSFFTEIAYIIKYKGTIAIKDLQLTPLDLHPEKLTLQEKMINRGRVFERLQGYHFKSFSGSALMIDNVYGSITIETLANERVIIDANAYNKYAPPPAPPAPIHSKYYHPSIPPPRHIPRSRNHGRARSPTRLPDDYMKRKTLGGTLTSDQCMLCIPHVRGFLLKSKRWTKFCVDGIRDIEWDEDAFSSLVLPNDEKDLILAFAEGRIDTRFDDFIRGKGRGIVMLLSGPPGVGKTLTAESVAETMRVPLYTLTAGELGTYPQDVEFKLRDALDKCAKWKAILLLDEADVFLERRELHDLNRNALVSVFLRLLEYHPGFTFLTTNRVAAFDLAFESRIDIAVNYPPLTHHLRRQIWANFLSRLSVPGDESESDDGLTWQCDIGEEGLDRLAAVELNGRQIKNAVKTGGILAGSRGKAVDLEILESVLKLRAHLLECH